jgi:hypothetical protein
MARVRQHAVAPVQPVRRRRAANVETLRTAAGDFLSRFGNLVDEVVALREAVAQSQAENDQLRAELAEALDLFREAGALVARTAPATRARGRAATRAKAAPAGAATRARTASTGGGGVARAARASMHGRATPASVTRDVVLAVIGKLGNATAAEVAAEISRAGAPVSGRAIRHIAKAAGAVMRRGDDGRMVYSLS